MNQAVADAPVNQAVLRGTKFAEYTVKDPVDQEFYDGEIWNPKPNESLVGIYVDALTDVGKYNQIMYVIDGDRLDGMYDKIFGCKSLDRQMAEIDKGTVIEIKYIGKNQEKNYHEYRISRLRKDNE